MSPFLSVVALITDYGTRDYYVAALKGVMLQVDPKVRVVDITNDIAPQNVAQAAFVLRQSWPWFPGDTVFLAIVDPGVGTGRRILAGRFGERFLVAPDNGLATLVQRAMPADALHVVENRRHFLPVRSSTFHGRDIMAPVAARIAGGLKLEELGPSTARMEMLPIADQAEVRPDGIYGRVLYVDRFGTLVTNIGRAQLDAVAGPSDQLLVALDGQTIGGVRATFADVAPGEAVALIGGCELLEVAVNQGSARERFGTVEWVRVFRS